MSLGNSDTPSYEHIFFSTIISDLNSSNRPVRTRMPGGVAGVQPCAAPYADQVLSSFRFSSVFCCCCFYKKTTTIKRIERVIIYWRDFQGNKV
jgi:hypothetical protein